MRVELAPALILHRRSYRESSLLIEAFTREHGRVGLVARGARRPKARWRGLLEPLRPLRLSWSGRGELRTLTGAEAGAAAPGLAGENLYAGFYAAELILRLTARDDPHPALFDGLAGLLAALASECEAAAPLRLFERDLLAAIGYAMPLTLESDTGEAVAADRQYLYHPNAGLRRAGVGETGGVVVTGDVLLGLAGGELRSVEQEAAARRLLGAALAPHLGSKPLRTAQTLRAMRRLNTTTRKKT